MLSFSQSCKEPHVALELQDAEPWTSLWLIYTLKIYHLSKLSSFKETSTTGKMFTTCPRNCRDLNCCCKEKTEQKKKKQVKKKNNRTTRKVKVHPTNTKSGPQKKKLNT